jgi:Ni/Fe-hydrogenase subunit HybB-like protein
MSILALLANACYSAAYFVDIPFHLSSSTIRNRLRWGLWIAGTIFAVVLANYWIADEIYADFH